MTDNIECEESIFHYIYQQYSRFVLSEAWKYCSSHYDVEDLVQEVWLILIERIGQLKSYSHHQFCGYVSVEMRNTAISRLCRRHVEYPLSFADNFSFDEAALINDMIDPKIRVEMFHNIWSNVPLKERELLERKYILS